MKLSKSKRLFINVGYMTRLIHEMKAWYKYDKRHGVHTSADAKAIKIIKQKRKKLIREALEASADEWEEAYYEGLRVGCDWEI
jgi:hypothetical protein